MVNGKNQNKIISKLIQLSFVDYLIILFLISSTFLLNVYGGIWYDTAVTYKNILRTFEGQTIFIDYLCPFFPIINYFFVPFVYFLGIDYSIIIITFIFNSLFAFYLSKYLSYYFSIDRLLFFYIIFFFFIPFGIGSFHIDHAAIIFSTFAFFIFFKEEKATFFSIILIVLSILTKYSLSFIIIFSGVSTYLLYLFINKKFKKLKDICIYTFLTSGLLILFLAYYIYLSEFSIVDIYQYFSNQSVIADRRVNINNFFFLEQIKKIFEFNSVGVFFQLPFILTMYFTLFYIIKNLLKKTKHKSIYLIIFFFLAHLLLFNFSGRDWNHKAIFGVILFFLMIHIHLIKLDSTLASNLFYKITTMIIFFIFMLIPLNERFDLKNLNIKNIFNEKLIKIENSRLYLSSSRSKFYEKHGIYEIPIQFNKINNFILSNRLENKNYFFIDEISSLFSIFLKKAPCDISCMNGDEFTPPKNSIVMENFWTNNFINKFDQKDGILIICKTQDNKFCSHKTNFNELDNKIEPGPRENFNLTFDNFINELNIIYKTKNFYLLSK